MYSNTKYLNKIILISLIISITDIAYCQPGADYMLGLPFSKYISSSEYNSGMLNSSITQDKRGFMYFANNFGLLEFDGNTWRTYPVRDGSKVRDLALDPGGKIYVGAQGDFGYFLPDSTGLLTYNSLSSDLPDDCRNFDDVWKVFIGKDEIFFCTQNKIYIFKEDLIAGVIDIEPTTNFFFLNNMVYMQMQDGGLYSLDNENLYKVIDPVLLPGYNIVSILPVPDNKFILITSGNGLLDMNGKRLYTSINSYQELRDATINVAIRLHNGNIALGTQNNGLIIFNDRGNPIVHLTKGSGLENRVVRTMFEDRHGNLWLGHNNGVSNIELSSPFSYINEDSGLPGSGYDAFNSGDNLFLATNNGLFRGSLSRSDLRFSLIPNSEGQAYSINEQNGSLLMGHHNGSYEITNNEVSLLNRGTGTWTFINLPEDKVNMIGGTYTGLELYRLYGSAWKFITPIDGFSESSRVMEYDTYGNIWMTHGYKGVYRLKLSDDHRSIIEAKFFGTDDGLPSQALTNVYKIENELVFTTLEGPYIFDYSTEKFKPEPVLSRYEELNKPLNFLVNDAKLNIYFLSRDGLGLLKKQIDGSYLPEIDVFNKITSFLNDDLEDISVINSNTVLFGAKEGFIVYNPQNPFPADNEFNTYIRSVTVSSRADSVIFSGSFVEDNQVVASQPASSIPLLPYKYNSVIFTYSANFMVDFDRTMYQHMLEGFEDHWSGWHSQPETSYTNLRKGDYTFRVRAKNIYNIESIESSYKFSVSAPWYFSKIAYATYLAVFITLFWLIIRYIDQKYSKSKMDFERIKQNEVDEISGKLDDLTQEKKVEIERLESEKLQSEIEYKNTELASITMNLLNKNIFIAQIKSNLTSITKKSKSDEVRDELARIKKEIDRNISYDEDWDQFTFHFNSVHGDFSKRLTKDYENLSAQDLRLCSYLRLNLSTKEIAHLLNISVRGVEISRYRLRKKLKLDRNENLAEFILNY